MTIGKPCLLELKPLPAPDTKEPIYQRFERSQAPPEETRKGTDDKGRDRRSRRKKRSVSRDTIGLSEGGISTPSKHEDEEEEEKKDKEEEEKQEVETVKEKIVGLGNPEFLGASHQSSDEG